MLTVGVEQQLLAVVLELPLCFVETFKAIPAWSLSRLLLKVGYNVFFGLLANCMG